MKFITQKWVHLPNKKWYPHKSHLKINNKIITQYGIPIWFENMRDRRGKHYATKRKGKAYRTRWLGPVFWIISSVKLKLWNSRLTQKKKNHTLEASIFLTLHIACTHKIALVATKRLFKMSRWWQIVKPVPINYRILVGINIKPNQQRYSLHLSRCKQNYAINHKVHQVL